MLEMMGFGEQRSIHGLIHPVYVLTAGLGKRLVSFGVRGGRMGSAIGEGDFFTSDRCFSTREKTLDLKESFVMGVVTKLSYGLVRALSEICVGGESGQLTPWLSRCPYCRSVRGAVLVESCCPMWKLGWRGAKACGTKTSDSVDAMVKLPGPD